MNLYVRFFDYEALVPDEASVLDFLSTIPQIRMECVSEKKLHKFIEGDSRYPFKGKIDDRNYYLVIKTEAPTLEAFQENQQVINQHPVGSLKKGPVEMPRTESREKQLCVEHYGWYEAGLVFKRAMPGDETRKFQYVDTPFRVRLKAYSGQDCYNRIVEHLRARPEVDPRSQFPSVKGKNFEFYFLEECN
ncbi:MAG: hypothetical protein IJA00_02005 [Bacteroidaceae bacterium]|nr:hypothetical protein [Bacteroidaceae bacterium]MBQ8192211.1 hypothetical protein [Bacteroidaceae bacterium]